jgi:hypothetical protein
MPNFFIILRNSPSWVYVLLALLIWLGLQSMRPRTVPVWRLTIIPVVFIGWGIASIFVQSKTPALLIADWLAAATTGVIVAWISTRGVAVRIDRAHRSVTMPGSVRPLIRNIAIFTAKYAIGVGMALLPRRRDELMIVNIGVSGAMAGYFLGWLGRFVLVYRRGPEAAPATKEALSVQASPVTLS